ncbi:MAG TPA: DUF3159 domain-containing protein [Terrimesophilobacter sp.]|nr:DUF3159 domain-containing protein [Terrimesophilobacter sp.]
MTDKATDPQSANPQSANGELSFSQAVSEGVSAAAKKAGIGQVAPGEMPTGQSLWKAVGGLRGVIEAIVPGLGFLVTYMFTGELFLSVAAPVVLSLVFVAIRVLTKSPVTQALAGVFGVALSAGLALFTGRAEDNFAIGLVINAVSLSVLLVSLAVRWPLVGIIVGILANEGSSWRDNPAKRRILVIATWLWVGLFAFRLGAQAPMYFSGQTEWLAATKLIMGVPLYAAMLWITWLLVRSVYARESEAQAVSGNT